ncbi:hypothetical protein [Pedobacter nutrimenti]|uniref:hypothetical protein n=1 Tax=Pedobacter nutrimenti TaxID=1241337 RepID=UPI0029319F91|nr:hypothetical protein [Pedobacter nutrimenti]
MKNEDFLHLEKLMNFLASHFLQKNAWADVSKSEWAYIVAELNGLLQERNKKQKIKKETDLFGTNYLYEHLIINKLKAYKGKKDLGGAVNLI